MTNLTKFQEEELAKARHVVTTGRGLLDYESYLCISRKDLSGKVILDLGSGVAKFISELADHFIDSARKPIIIGLDIAHDFQRGGAGKALLDKNIEAVKIKHPDTVSFVSGLFSELPFESDLFDFVFSLYAFPLHIKEERYFERGLLEIIRVLRPGGIAKLAPLEYHSGGVDEENRENFLTYFYNKDHFDQIFRNIEAKCNGVTFASFKNKSGFGVEIRKS